MANRLWEQVEHQHDLTEAFHQYLAERGPYWNRTSQVWGQVCTLCHRFFKNGRDITDELPKDVPEKPFE